MIQFDSWNNHWQQYHRNLYVKCDGKKVKLVHFLCKYTKRHNIFDYNMIYNEETSCVDIKILIPEANHYINYPSIMTSDSLVGIVNLGDEADVKHPATDNMV